MPVTIAQLKAVKLGDAIYRTSRMLEVVRVERTQIAARDSGGTTWYFQIYEKWSRDRIRRIVPAERRRKGTSRSNYEFARLRTGDREASGFAHEGNDCTVWALAKATSVDYAVAHAHMQAHGRNDEQGSSWEQCRTAYPAARLGGFAGRTPIEIPNRTLARWFKSGELPARCIVLVRRHAFAVVSGQVQDSFQVGSARRVRAVFGFVKEEL